MEKELLTEIKNHYLDLKKRKETKLKEMQEITELEQDDKVKRYMKLCEGQNRDIFLLELSDDALMERSFYKVSYKITKTNDIYFCFGYFSCHSYDSEMIKVPDGDPRADCKIYQNLENDTIYKTIELKKCPEFEQNHKIIYSKSLNNYDREYYLLQQEFIKACLEEGQEKAIERILNK